MTGEARRTAQAAATFMRAMNASAGDVNTKLPTGRASHATALSTKNQQMTKLSEKAIRETMSRRRISSRWEVRGRDESRDRRFSRLTLSALKRFGEAGEVVAHGSRRQFIQLVQRRPDMAIGHTEGIVDGAGLLDAF